MTRRGHRTTAASMEDPWLPAILAAFIPALLWLAFFWTRDRYEREPTRAVLIFFAMGGLLAVPLASSWDSSSCPSSRGSASPRRGSSACSS